MGECLFLKRNLGPRKIVVVPNAVDYGSDAWSVNNSTYVTMTVDETQTVFKGKIPTGTGSVNRIRYATIPIDLTKYKTMKLVGKVKLTKDDSGGLRTRCGLFSAKPKDYDTDNFAVGYTKWLNSDTTSADFDETYDISALSGVYYFGFYDGFTAHSSGQR